jgi:hypothetical protein
LRRQYSGCVPLSKQEKLSQLVRDATEDRWRTAQLLREAEDKRSEAEAAVEELASKRQGLLFVLNLLLINFLFRDMAPEESYSFIRNEISKTHVNMWGLLSSVFIKPFCLQSKTALFTQPFFYFLGIDELVTVMKQGSSAATKQVWPSSNSLCISSCFNIIGL